MLGAGIVKYYVMLQGFEGAGHKAGGGSDGRSGAEGGADALVARSLG